MLRNVPVGISSSSEKPLLIVMSSIIVSSAKRLLRKLGVILLGIRSLFPTSFPREGYEFLLILLFLSVK
jgi:hypothetical protein